MGDPLVVFLLPSSGTVSVAGGMAPTAGLYGFNDAPSVTGPSDIYAQLGLTNGAAALTVAELVGAAQTQGLPGSGSYLVQAVEVPQPLAPGQPLSLVETGAPPGTVVLGYDCVTDCTSGGIAATLPAGIGIIGNNGTLLDPSPALLASTAPVSTREPAMLSILGLALIGIAFFSRRCLGVGRQ